MLTEDYSSNEELILNRRTFLLRSGLGTAGLILYPFSSASASPVITALSVFARSVGAAILTQLITEYVKQKVLSTSTVDQVNRTNRMMADNAERFSDLSISHIHQVNNNYFFYPARSIVHNINACAAFFDKSRGAGQELVGLVEGPSLFGIAELSKRILSSKSEKVVRDALLPIAYTQPVNGSLLKPYMSPEIYKTREGRVETHYKSDGKTGEVTVKAIREGGTLLAEGTYELDIRA